MYTLQSLINISISVMGLMKRIVQKKNGNEKRDSNTIENRWHPSNADFLLGGFLANVDRLDHLQDVYIERPYCENYIEDTL